MKRNFFAQIAFLLMAGLSLSLLTACKSEGFENNEKLNVVATTTIVGDVVKMIGGEQINLTVLLSPGIDPHGFDPSPKDLAAITDADLIFSNGAGLEEFLEPIIESTNSQDKLVEVSEGIILIGPAERHDDKVEEAEDEQHEDADDHTGGDPHTWTDPNHVIVWVTNIAIALQKADRQNSAYYGENAAAYEAELLSLDAWIRDQVALIPLENREIVTDHQLFGYFVERYGFEQVGAIIPSYSTAAEASASDVAALQDAIIALDARAIFVGNTVNPNLAEQISRDTGVSLHYIYTGSLSDANGDAPTYIEYIRYNVNIIVSALR